MPTGGVIMLHATGLGRVGIAAVALLAMSCLEREREPTNVTGPSLVGESAASDRQTSHGSGAHGNALTAVSGRGTGIVNVTTTSEADGFSAEITVNVVGAPPSTDFYVQRAPEIGRENSSDGVCQRATGAAPWGPPTPNFVTFPVPLAGPLVILRTSPGGSGAVHIKFDLPTIADGTAFDVMFRLVDDLTSPVNDLRTACFTVLVK
jgi:hypothetical protein